MRPCKGQGGGEVCSGKLGSAREDQGHMGGKEQLLAGAGSFTEATPGHRPTPAGAGQLQGTLSETSWGHKTSMGVGPPHGLSSSGI